VRALLQRVHPANPRAYGHPGGIVFVVFENCDVLIVRRIRARIRLGQFIFGIELARLHDDESDLLGRNREDCLGFWHLDLVLDTMHDRHLR
jgi:hypothetical protein